MNSSFSMGASSTARQALISPGITQANESKILVLKAFSISSWVQMLLLQCSTSVILSQNLFNFSPHFDHTKAAYWTLFFKFRNVTTPTVTVLISFI